MRVLGLLSLFLFFVSQVLAQCGPPQCYTGGCTDARVQVDFVFLIDDSGSMAEEIAGVRAGLNAFAQSIHNTVSAQYAVVTFGRANVDPKRQLQLTSSLASLSNTLYSIQTNGGQEAGLEALLAALDMTNTKKLGLNFRHYAKKVFILLTDEDSDPSYYSSNRFVSTYSLNNYCKDSGMATQIPTDHWDNGWQKEIDAVANALIANQVSTYFMVNPDKNHKYYGQYDNCNAFYQYCHPGSAVENSDYSGFNVQATLNNLNNNNYGKSVQGQLLSASLTARCFDVNAANNADLVSNFYQAISKDLAFCNPCYTYNCVNNQCQAPIFNNNMCGCDGKLSNPLKTYDCAGICGGNHAPDTCGVCTVGGKLSPQCVQDCNGKFYDSNTQAPPHIKDKCNQCYAVSGPAPFCRQDCDGKWTITTQEAWEALNGCVEDCHGVKGGTAAYDSCGRCLEETDVPTNPCVQDCNGDWYINGEQQPLHVSHPVDTCGECVPSGHNGTRDDCDQCKNAIGYDSNSCIKDCKNVWRLANDPETAVTDLCGECWKYDELENFNSDMDECGVCNGGNADLKIDTQNVTCCHPLTDCADVTGPGKTSCDDCPPPPKPCPHPDFPDDPTKNVEADLCGLCEGHIMYNKTDECGLCCTDPTPGTGDCNFYKDSCNKCFGLDAHLKYPCPNCNNKPDSTECLDCLGVPFGKAVVDCEGICGGTATDCNECGDGKVGGTEECDDGKANGTPDSNCNSDCSLKVAGSSAAIIGGVVGAILAVVLLAAVAFLAFKYAVSHGLLSKASNTVDMGASNSNPLYKSETQVKSNPLYQA